MSEYQNSPLDPSSHQRLYEVTGDIPILVFGNRDHSTPIYLLVVMADRHGMSRASGSDWT